MEMIMNVKPFDAALDFVPATNKGRNGGFREAVSLWFAALNEGINLAGEYKDLTAHGVRPDVAVRKVFSQIKA